MTAKLASALVLLVLAAPAAVSARTQTIGSDLEARASRSQSAPVDSVYWNTRLPGRRVRVPRRGQVRQVRIKGRIPVKGSAPPNVAMLAQVLRPRRGGRTQVISTSAPIPPPFGGRRDRITTFRPFSQCARKGDYVALATSGGFGPAYPDGAVFAMFARAPGAAFTSFTGAGMDMNGNVFRGTAHPGRELLMQVRIGSGRSAPNCSS